MDSDTRHFRAGVGTVIYTRDKKIAWFKRAYFPIGLWQFQQGGINDNELPETTLWRELHEEVGLTKDDIAAITEYPKWTAHPYPDDFLTNDDGTFKKRIGQVHRWFFLELKNGIEIDLEKASEDEFSAWEWTDFPSAIEASSEHKAPVYGELYNFFKEKIEPTL